MSKLAMALGVSLVYTSAAAAHHSAAEFDQQKEVALTGVVKQFQWTNPHCWIQLIVMSGDGPREWSIEMGSPADVYRRGWKPGTLKVGHRIAMIVHPGRDRTAVASLVSATGADGRILGRTT